MPTLKIGSRGVYVQILQLALLRAGFSVGEKDGIFGNVTRNAVIDFQRAYGLRQDGIVGMLTWAMLKPFLTGYVVHTVSRGETFWQIANRYNTSVNAIRTANPDISPMNLQIGTRVVVPLDFAVVPTDIDYCYDLVRYITEGLAMRYPFIETGSFGKSEMGKELYFMKIGSGSKQVFYNATHHANEWINTPVMLKFLEELARAYVVDSRIAGYRAREIFATATIFMAPLVNPDGLDLVTGALDTDSYYYSEARRIASNYPQISFPSGWKANILGTDLNLNYPANWEEARRIKFEQGYTTPAPRDYVGTEPLSARESRAVYDFTLRHDFRLILAYHSQGEVIYWKYLDYDPEGAEEIVRQFARVSGYTPEITPSESAFAGYKDWFIQNYNRPGYTVETGKGINPLPLSQFDKIYRDNVGIFTLGAILA